MNVNFGLFPELPKAGKIRGKDRKQALSARALADLATWLGAREAAE
jgi:methylenetetrahydrofolate--tRNA-(uracil-5-)-methyltransferase